MSFQEHIAQQTYLAYLAVLRIVVGYFFLQYGWEKLNQRFLSGEQLVRQLSRATNDPLSFHRDFILQVVVPHSHFFAHLISYSEIAIGLSLIFGLLVRLFSTFGIFHNLNIFFALALPSGGAQIGLNRIFIVLQLMFVFAAAGRAFGLDGILARRYGRSWIF